MGWSPGLHPDGAWIYMRGPGPSLAPATLWLLASAGSHAPVCSAGLFPWCLQLINVSPFRSQLSQWWLAPLCWRDLPLVLHLLPDSAALLRLCQRVSCEVLGQPYWFSAVSNPLDPDGSCGVDTSPLHPTACSSLFALLACPQLAGTLHCILPLIFPNREEGKGPFCPWCFPQIIWQCLPNSHLDNVSSKMISSRNFRAWSLLIINLLNIFGGKGSVTFGNEVWWMKNWLSQKLDLCVLLQLFVYVSPLDNVSIISDSPLSDIVSGTA